MIKCRNKVNKTCNGCCPTCNSRVICRIEDSKICIGEENAEDCHFYLDTEHPRTMHVDTLTNED